MQNIYQKCSTCLVWLRPSDWDVENVRHLILSSGFSTLRENGRDLNKLRGTKSTWDVIRENWAAQLPYSSFEGRHNPLLALATLLSRPWFSRAWVVQEVALAPKAVFIAGADCLNLYDLVGQLGEADKYIRDRFQHDRALNLLFEPDHTLEDASRACMLIYHYHKDIHSKNSTEEDTLLNARGRWDLLDIFVMTAGQSQATDPRDLIYAFLGLLDERVLKHIVPDYAKPDTLVFVAAMRSILRIRGDLSAFTEFWYEIPVRIDGSLLPSWVLAPSHRPSGSCPMRSASRDWVLDTFCADRYRLYKHVVSDFHDQLILSGRAIDRIDLVTTHRRRDNYIDDIIPEMSEASAYEDAQFDISRIVGELNEALEDRNRSATHSVEVSDRQVRNLFRKSTSNGDDGDVSMEITRKASLAAGFVNDTMSRVAFLTKSASLGLGPSSMRHKDIICILHGSRLPIILGANGKGQYTYVGPCYLEGAMFGERTTWAEEDADEFVLV